MNASRMTIPVVTPDYYSTPYDQTEEYETSTCPKDEEIIVIPEQFRHIFYGDDESDLAFAGMANPGNTPEELGMLAVDCGAWETYESWREDLSHVGHDSEGVATPHHGKRADKYMERRCSSMVRPRCVAAMWLHRAAPI
jgi:hypothetical protein